MKSAPSERAIKRMEEIHADLDLAGEILRDEVFSHLRNVAAYQDVPSNRHPVAVYLSRLSANSRPTMRAALATAADILTADASRIDELPWHRLRYDDVHRLRNLLVECYAPATVNRILAAVRGVLRACQTLGYISAEQQLRVSAIPSVPNSGLREDLYLPVGTLLRTCKKDPRPAGRRDAALFILLYRVGLRSIEAVNLNLADYSSARRTLTIRQGAGNSDRQLTVSSGTAEVLHHWVCIRGPESGPFLVPISKNGRLQPRRLTTRAIAWILQQRLIEADVPPFSPRDLRRNYLLRTDL